MTWTRTLSVWRRNRALKHTCDIAPRLQILEQEPLLRGCFFFPLLGYAFCSGILKALSLQLNCTGHVNKWHPGTHSGIRVCLFRRGFQEWGSTLPSTENSVYHFGDAIKITNVQSKPNSLCYLVFEIHKYVKQKTSNRPFYPGNSVHIIFLSLVQKLPRELSAHPSSI